MATYKSEFLAHYYKGRLRPIAAYAFGMMYWWARIAAHMPRVANFFTQTPGLRAIAKHLVTMAPERSIPRFANQTFREWFAKREIRNAGKPQVMLWPDTWNNHFHPDTAKAAVRVLEAAGFQVIIPTMSLCCGRPLYDYGMLPTARKLLLQILKALEPQIHGGVPLVGLEPSCVSVFRVEMRNMLHGNPAAETLARQTYLLTEFLAKQVPDFKVPKLQRKAIVHGHCHQKSVLDFDDEKTVLKELGLDFEVLDSGCCGMAGAFGFEKGEHYDVSIKCGERVLLPKVRSADADTLLVSNGFSCREQISQTTDREALHIAQVLAMAIEQNGSEAGH